MLKRKFISIFFGIIILGTILNVYDVGKQYFDAFNENIEITQDNLKQEKTENNLVNSNEVSIEETKTEKEELTKIEEKELEIEDFSSKIGQKYQKIKPSFSNELTILEENKEIKNQENVEKKNNFPINETSEIKNNKKETNDAFKIEPKTNADFEIIEETNEGELVLKDATNNSEKVEEILQSTDNLLVTSRSGFLRNASVPMAARLFKKNSDGTLYFGCDKNIPLYLNEGLSQSIGYTNACYADDVGLVKVSSTNPDAALIVVSGKTAWVKISRDLILFPASNAVNPSYYINQDGYFYHVISTDVTNTNADRSFQKIGKTNSSLKNNVKYYSYDGNYFYESYSQLMNDYKNQTRENSVNKNNIYYSYFQFMPLNIKTKYSASELNKFINSKVNSSSKLYNTGQAFIDAQNYTGINALLMLGIAINESNWGNSQIAQSNNNLFGLNAVDSSPGSSASYFRTVEQSIQEFSRIWLRQSYADPEDFVYYGALLGNKNIGMNINYASDAYWGEKAASYMLTMDDALGSKDYMTSTFGVFKAPNSVKNEVGTQLYPIVNYVEPVPGLSSYTETTIAITGERNQNEYFALPDRQNVAIRGVPSLVPYDANFKAVVSKNGIHLVGKQLVVNETVKEIFKVSDEITLQQGSWFLSADVNGTRLSDPIAGKTYKIVEKATNQNATHRYKVSNGKRSGWVREVELKKLEKNFKFAINTIVEIKKGSWILNKQLHGIKTDTVISNQNYTVIGYVFNNNATHDYLVSNGKVTGWVREIELSETAKRKFKISDQLTVIKGSWFLSKEVNGNRLKDPIAGKTYKIIEIATNTKATHQYKISDGKTSGWVREIELQR